MKWCEQYSTWEVAGEGWLSSPPHRGSSCYRTGGRDGSESLWGTSHLRVYRTDSPPLVVLKLFVRLDYLRCS